MELMSGHYDLSVSKEAWSDIASYIDYITYTCDAPKTGKKHYDDLLELLANIQKNPTVNTVRNPSSLSQYGMNIRRANYKKMTILYTIINGNMVYVCRVVASSMITEL